MTLRRRRGSVRNKLQVDAGCGKVHASASKASCIWESTNFLWKLSYDHTASPAYKAFPRVSTTSPDVFSIIGNNRCGMVGKMWNAENRQRVFCGLIPHQQGPPWSTIWQPGFDLPRRTWSLLNRFRTGQGPCRANLHKWGLAQSPSCDCGQRQTMNHIVDTCPLTKSEGGLNLLHEADDDAVIWLESTATAALAKWNEHSAKYPSSIFRIPHSALYPCPHKY